MDPNFTEPCLMLPQLNYMKYVITTFCELELFLMFSQPTSWPGFNGLSNCDFLFINITSKKNIR